MSKANKIKPSRQYQDMAQVLQSFDARVVWLEVNNHILERPDLDRLGGGTNLRILGRGI